MSFKQRQREHFFRAPTQIIHWTSLALLFFASAAFLVSDFAPNRDMLFMIIVSVVPIYTIIFLTWYFFVYRRQ